MPLGNLRIELGLSPRQTKVFYDDIEISTVVRRVTITADADDITTATIDVHPSNVTCELPEGVVRLIATAGEDKFEGELAS